MPKYGRINQDGSLSLSSKQLEGYKAVEYAKIPEFDQSTHYVVQATPTEETERIFVDVVINELPADLNDGAIDDEFV